MNTKKRMTIRGLIMLANGATLIVLCLLTPATVKAQWTTPDGNGNINNTNSGNVGVGTSSPQSKLDVLGSTGLTLRTGASSAGFSLFDRPTVPGDQLFFQGNAGNYSVFNVGTKNATLAAPKLSAIALWTVENAASVNATQFQIQHSPTYGPVMFTQKFGTGAQGDKKISLQSVWGQVSVPTQLVLETNGNIGIGTSNPLGKFQIVAPSYTDTSIPVWDNHFFVVGADSNTGGISLSYNQATNTGYLMSLSPNVAWRNTVIQPFAGNVGIGNTAPTERLHVTGNVKIEGSIDVTGNIKAKYQDVAEWVESSQTLQPATVAVLDSSKSNQVVASTQAYDSRVAGVIALRPGLALGEEGEGRVLVATTGRVKVKVDATNGPIQIGDLLVTSDKEGFAMKSLPLDIGGVRFHRPGTIVGKALEPLAQGTGEILVLLSMQ